MSFRQRLARLAGTRFASRIFQRAREFLSRGRQRIERARARIHVIRENRRARRAARRLRESIPKAEPPPAAPRRIPILQFLLQPQDAVPLRIRPRWIDHARSLERRTRELLKALGFPLERVPASQLPPEPEPEPQQPFQPRVIRAPRRLADLVEELERMAVPTPLADGKHVMQWMTTATGGLDRMLDMIRRARRTVYMEYYAYKLSLIGSKFLAELIDAAERGVEVKVCTFVSIWSSLTWVWAGDSGRDGLG
jgi:hypothetical protein